LSSATSFESPDKKIIHLKLIVMKTKLIIAFIGIGVVLSASAKGQFAFVEPSKVRTPSYLRTENASEAVYYNNISTRAIRNFVLNFPEISNENWLSTADLFVAMFTLNDISYRIDYDKKGNWIETFRTYDETNMSSDLRQIIKSSYYDYDIYLVQDIEQPFHPTIYIVHLDGKKQLINLQVCNGVIHEWQKFKKSK
jgi:hypothetical protein